MYATFVAAERNPYMTYTYTMLALSKASLQICKWKNRKVNRYPLPADHTVGHPECLPKARPKLADDFAGLPEPPKAEPKPASQPEPLPKADSKRASHPDRALPNVPSQRELASHPARLGFC